MRTIDMICIATACAKRRSLVYSGGMGTNLMWADLGANEKVDKLYSRRNDSLLTEGER
jgi:hypothetical protein